jgi:hypothetical protein
MEIFVNDQLENIWNDVLLEIKSDREQYRSVYISIEEYILDNRDVIIGGTMGVNLLLGKNRDIDDYMYELYTENSFIHANNIVNNISKNLTEYTFPPKIVILKSIIPHKKYQIVVDNRIIAVLYDLSKNSVKIIGPVLVDNFDKNMKVSVLPAEMQLINLYRILYTPNNASEWELAIHDENQLFKLLSETIHTKIGGSIKAERSRVQNLLLEKFIKNNDQCVLIGDHAMHMIDNHFDINTNILQVISSKSIEDDYAEICNIINTSLPVSYNTRDLHIMRDFRLLRTAIKLGDHQSGEQKEIIYIYNSASYDLVPFNRFLLHGDFINVANPFVIIRFLLIDFWIIRLIESVGGIDKKFSNMRLESIRSKVIGLRSMLSDGKLTTIRDEHINRLSGLGVFGIEYIGKYENEDISQKFKAKDIQKKYYDYYPQEYYKKNKSYRIVN